MNMSHSIKSLSFGPHYPGQVNPLDNLKRMLEKEMQAFKYFIKVRKFLRLGGAWRGSLEGQLGGAGLVLGRPAGSEKGPRQVE